MANGKRPRGKAAQDILYAGVLAGVPARDAHGRAPPTNHPGNDGAGSKHAAATSPPSSRKKGKAE